MEKPFVLLADDNEATCTLIIALLHNDFVVDVANDGMQAVDKLKGRQYSAILLDLLMPNTDGYTVLDFLARERPADLGRVLVVTASLTPMELKRVKSYPIHGIIRKPFEVDVLLAAVKDVAGRADPPVGGTFLSSSMLVLLADLLRQRWM